MGFRRRRSKGSRSPPVQRRKTLPSGKENCPFPLPRRSAQHGRKERSQKERQTRFPVKGRTSFSRWCQPAPRHPVRGEEEKPTQRGGEEVLPEKGCFSNRREQIQVSYADKEKGRGERDLQAGKRGGKRERHFRRSGGRGHVLFGEKRGVLEWEGKGGALGKEERVCETILSQGKEREGTFSARGKGPAESGWQERGATALRTGGKEGGRAAFGGGKERHHVWGHQIAIKPNGKTKRDPRKGKNGGSEEKISNEGKNERKGGNAGRRGAIASP